MDIERNIDNLTGGKGLAWMNQYLGNTNITSSPLYLPQNRDMTLPGWLEGGAGTNTVNLFPGWQNQDGGVRWIVHEMGHVWDMNTSTLGDPSLGPTGGVGDALSSFFGGYPYGPRFVTRDPLSPFVPQNYLFRRFTYGNTSTADYLAETFSGMIYHPEYFPPGVNQRNWVESAISVEASQLP